MIGFAGEDERWTIEPSFRDSKDLRFGMGMSALRIDDPQRRDRLLLLNAFAILLLTILGAAGESPGMDRQLRTSTVKRRVHSLCAPCRRVSLVEEDSTRISVDGSGS